MNAWFDALRAFIARNTGVEIAADYSQIAEARLAPVMRTFELHSLDAMIFRAIAGTDDALARSIIETMMTGETFFFRDRKPFEVLREHILPEIVQSRDDERSLRIWSAACSSGQEAYSIAMLLDEMARDLRGWSTQVIATDVSTSAIEKARAGRYNQFEVQRGLPIAMLLRYFNRDGESWSIAEHIRSGISFEHLNLLQDFRHLEQFDIIFCRNVIMYLANDIRRAVISRLLDRLRPGGWLVIGATETLPGNFNDVVAHPSCAGLYRRASRDHAVEEFPRLAASNG